MTAEGSRPEYDVRVVKHVKIPMSDGTQLDAHMAMPEAPGRFPAVFDYYPYRKDDLSAATMRYHHYLARRGFVALRLDVRGSGGSEGIAEDEYSLQEHLDGVEAMDRTFKAPRRSDVDLLGEALETSGRDQVTVDTIRMAAALVGAGH